jgi:hypothetical protein
MKRSSHAFSIVLLAIFIGCAVTQFLAAGDIRALMLDTDALNIPTVVDNVITHSGSLSHWYLSPAPYLFPDALVHAVIQPFASNTYARLAVFAAVQIAALFALLWWLAVRTLRQHPLAVSVAISGNLVFVALMRGGPFNQLMTAGFHYGAFLISIAVVVLTLSTQRRSNWVVIAVLSFLASLSDNIFIIQTAVPLAVTLLLVALFDTEHRCHRIISAGTVAVSSVLGSLMYGVFITHETRYPIHFTSEKFRSNAHAVKLILRDFASNHEPLGAAVIVSGVIAIFYVLRLMKRIRRTSPIAIVSIFAFGSVVSTCVGLALATTNEMTIRYFIPVFTWPLIVCGLIIFNTDMLREKVPVLVATFTAIVLCLNTSTRVDTHGIERDYYPTDVACIDNALPNLGQLHGMSNYWDAKYIQSFSKRDITVAQYWDNLTPMKWITSDDYYRSSYDFAVISTNMPPQFTLSRELLEKTFGQPTASVTCGSRIVLVFQRGA